LPAGGRGEAERPAGRRLETGTAEDLLETMKQSLAVMHAHRRPILAELAGKPPD
jgi:hypothetical protein